MNEIKKTQFEELQKMIDKKKAEVKSGEMTTDMYYAYICGLLGAELFRYYEATPNTSLDKGGKEMSIYVRADFDFKDEKNGIKHCTGYVVCKDVVMTDYGCDFKVHSVVIKKLIARNPDFEKLEQLAIQNCKVLREEY